MPENRISAAARSIAEDGDEQAPTGPAIGDVVGFVLFPNEVVPAVVAALHTNERIDCKATIVIPERRPNPDPFAGNRFVIAHVESQRLQQRVRKFDPPVQRDQEHPLESFTLVHAAQEPGGPMTPGTWFDLSPWVVRLVCTKYEQKDRRGVVTVPGELKEFGPWSGSDYAAAFRSLDEQRRLAWFDRVELRFALGSTL